MKYFYIEVDKISKRCNICSLGEANAWMWIRSPHTSNALRYVAALHNDCNVTALWCPNKVKGPYADHILIPQGSTGSSIFFDIKWKPMFFWLQFPKFQLQILCSFGDITKMVKLIGIPENNFLCIFIIASSPGVHTFFFLWRVNKKLPRGETSQNAFQRSRSIN